MGKPKKQRRVKFNYDKDRKKAWKKSKKLPAIKCPQIKSAWDHHKSALQNMRDMGLSSDPNKTIKIPLTKELLMPGFMTVKKKVKKQKFPKSHVVKELEMEANIPQEKTLQFSGPEASFAIYMMENHGEDYKAMSRDPKNYYQETPKQIKKKINTFKNIPAQYNAYLKSKEVSASDMDTS